LQNETAKQNVEASDFVEPQAFRSIEPPEPIKRPLTAKMSRVEIDGSFHITFSDEIQLLHKESVVAKNAASVSIFWMNDAIRLSKTSRPDYKVKLVDLDSRSIYFKLIFDDPILISRGITEDVVTVTFNSPDFFLRISD